MKNPRVIHEKQLYPTKCTVWCGMRAQGIIGPYFVETEDGTPLTVNSERYRIMLENVVCLALENRPEMWFQQDGATSPTTRPTIQLLTELFGELIISRRSDISYPPRLPDLTPPDFFLWGYLKMRVYFNKPRTRDQLMNNIRAEIRLLKG